MLHLKLRSQASCL
uniref:Uncharacterized protein n=1 Tax=Arundo donax TaxID=35708 RepID=A0A0A9BQD5_ARUDO